MVSPSKMADAAKEHRSRPPPRPKVYNIFCKFQNRIEHIYVHEFDISNGVYGLKGYLSTLSAMKDRQIRLSPFLINGIPVTPLVNTVTAHSSFFIIRLVDSTNPMYRVDLLFRDTDLYFVGFRRELVKVEEDAKVIMIEEGKESGGSKGEEKKRMTKKEKARAATKVGLKENKAGWGEWHCFSDDDMRLPGYFHATSCGIGAGYGEGRTPGGCETFGEILLTLALFDEGKVSKGQLRRACYCVMVMFSEASRLRSVLTEMFLRIVRNMSPDELGKELTVNMNNWTQLGRVALTARLDGQMEPWRKLKKNFANKFAAVVDRKHQLNTLGDVIDEHTGEVMLINSEAKYLGFDVEEIEDFAAAAKKECNSGPAYKRDFMF